MKTQVPKIKIENGKLQTEGDFKFELSPTIITENFIPIKTVTFDCTTPNVEDVKIRATFTDKYGNTSAASIPMAMNYAYEQGNF